MTANVLDFRADLVLSEIKKDLKNDNDSVAIDHLIGTSAPYLQETLDGEIKNWTIEEIHEVIAILIKRFGGGDGIEFDKLQTTPMWLAATPAIDGRLPSENPTDRRWIRLDTVTAVYAKPSIAVAEDVRDWLFSLTVQTEEKLYHASPVRFRGEMVNSAVDKILNAVSIAVRA
jgi:hypothetical protein